MKKGKSSLAANANQQKGKSGGGGGGGSPKSNEEMLKWAQRRAAEAHHDEQEEKFMLARLGGLISAIFRAVSQVKWGDVVTGQIQNVLSAMNEATDILKNSFSKWNTEGWSPFASLLKSLGVQELNIFHWLKLAPENEQQQPSEMSHPETNEDHYRPKTDTDNSGNDEHYRQNMLNDHHQNDRPLFHDHENHQVRVGSDGEHHHQKPDHHQRGARSEGLKIKGIGMARV